MLNSRYFSFRNLLILVATILLISVWGCGFLGERDRGQYKSVNFDFSQEVGAFHGMGANVPISFYNRRTKPLQTLHDLAIKFIRVKRESDNWDNILALRSAGSRLGVKWIYTLEEIPGVFLNGHGQLVDVDGFAEWWAEEVDELYYQEVPADYIEFLENPDLAVGDSLVMSPDTYNELIHACRKKLDLRGFDWVGFVGPGLSTPVISGDYETWYMDLDQVAFDALDYWSVQVWENRLGSENFDLSLNKLTKYLEHIESQKPIFVSSYASSMVKYGSQRYPNPAKYDQQGNLNTFKTYYYSASFSTPYGLNVYSNTLNLLKERDVTPFIYQLYDAPDDVKFKKQSWGLLDLNGSPKPVFSLLAGLLKHLPDNTTVVSAEYEAIPGLNALAFKSAEEAVLTLVNEADESRSIQVQLKGLGSSIEIVQSVVRKSPEIYSPLLGQRDLILEQEIELKSRYDSASDTYSLLVSLQPLSTLVSQIKLN